MYIVFDIWLCSCTGYLNAQALLHNRLEFMIGLQVGVAMWDLVFVVLYSEQEGCLMKLEVKYPWLNLISKIPVFYRTQMKFCYCADNWYSHYKKFDILTKIVMPIGCGVGAEVCSAWVVPTLRTADKRIRSLEKSLHILLLYHAYRRSLSKTCELT